MKRHIIKDVIVALLPPALFLAYALPARGLLVSSRATYNMLPLPLFNLIVPVLIGAVLCTVLIYAWENRTSTVCIYLYCGAFLMNIFFVLCQLGVFGSPYNMVLVGGLEGVDLAGVINGTYMVMFWASLVSFIKARKRAG